MDKIKSNRDGCAGEFGIFLVLVVHAVVERFYVFASNLSQFVPQVS